MKLTISIDDKTHHVRDDGGTAVISGLDACPRCGRKGDICTRGNGKRVESRYTYASDGHAVCCGAHLGTLRAQVDTIFGIEEDERVTAGPWRVY